MLKKFTMCYFIFTTHFNVKMYIHISWLLNNRRSSFVKSLLKLFEKHMYTGLINFVVFLEGKYVLSIVLENGILHESPSLSIYIKRACIDSACRRNFMLALHVRTNQARIPSKIKLVWVVYCSSDSYKCLYKKRKKKVNY